MLLAYLLRHATLEKHHVIYAHSIHNGCCKPDYDSFSYLFHLFGDISDFGNSTGPLEDIQSPSHNNNIQRIVLSASTI